MNILSFPQAVSGLVDGGGDTGDDLDPTGAAHSEGEENGECGNYFLFFCFAHSVRVSWCLRFDDGFSHASTLWPYAPFGYLIYQTTLDT